MFPRDVKFGMKVVFQNRSQRLVGSLVAMESQGRLYRPGVDPAALPPRDFKPTDVCWIYVKSLDTDDDRTDPMFKRKLSLIDAQE